MAVGSLEALLRDVQMSSARPAIGGVGVAGCRVVAARPGFRNLDDDLDEDDLFDDEEMDDEEYGGLDEDEEFDEEFDDESDIDLDDEDEF